MLIITLNNIETVEVTWSIILMLHTKMVVALHMKWWWLLALQIWQA